VIPFPACIIWHCVPEAKPLAGPGTATPATTGLRQMGNVRAYLWVAKGNDRAITFCEKHGWALDGHFKDDAGFTPTLRELRMSARLVSNG
jgi:hypothetical protein